MNVWTQTVEVLAARRQRRDTIDAVRAEAQESGQQGHDAQQERDERRMATRAIVASAHVLLNRPGFHGSAGQGVQIVLPALKCWCENSSCDHEQGDNPHACTRPAGLRRVKYLGPVCDQCFAGYDERYQLPFDSFGDD